MKFTLQELNDENVIKILNEAFNNALYEGTAYVQISADGSMQNISLNEIMEEVEKMVKTNQEQF